MRVLVVGGGGREHALVWSLSKSPLVADLLCAPGNPGIAELARCRPVAVDDLPGMVAMATREFVDLVVVGPEVPLVGGLADALRPAGIRVFGPGAAGARLEGSKRWAKSLMAAAGIPTAASQSFERADEAIAYARRLIAAGTGAVVKADGLAAGKGVTVCDDGAQAAAAIADALDRRVFGPAGSRVLIEERLDGEELSVLAFSDGESVLAMQAAQDFKRAHDGDLGPNTGGMGSHSPVPSCTPGVAGTVTDRVLEPIAAALAAGGEPYVGVIYAGIMLTPDGPKVLEFNCRFGDPETQAVLPRLRSDLLALCLAAREPAGLAGVTAEFEDDWAVTVVIASAGYPASSSKGDVISGLVEAAAIGGVEVTHAGTARANGDVVTAGGRVLNVTGLGATPGEARDRAYEAAKLISFDGMQMRSDIAARAVDRVAAG